MNHTKRWSYALTLILVIIGYFLLTGLISSGMISRYQTTVMIFICINIILAVSLNITVGCLGQITIGHAGFMSVGAYTAALFAKTGIVEGSSQPQPRKDKTHRNFHKKCNSTGFLRKIIRKQVQKAALMCYTSL